MRPIRPKYIIRLLKGRTKWRWRTEFANGHILLTSETYSSRAKAQQAAKNNFNSYKPGHAKMVVKS